MTRERRIDVVFLLGGAVLTLLMFTALLETRAGAVPGSLALPKLALMLAQVIVLSTAVFFAAGSSRRFEAGNPVRRCWAVLALGLFLLVLGEATEAVYAVVWAIEDPFPSLADLFFLLAYPLLVLAFLLFLRAYRQSGFQVESGRGAFAWGVAGALGLVGLATLAPAVHSSAPLAERLIGVGYAVLDLIALVPILLLLRVTWGFRGGDVWKVWAGILFGFVFTFLGDLLFAYLKTVGPGGIGPLAAPQLDSLTDLMFLLSYLAIARGTLHQRELLGD